MQTRAPQIHVLRTTPADWDAIGSGTRAFDVRRDDLGIAVGDVLVLRRHDPVSGYSHDKAGKPRDIARRVTYIMQGSGHGIEPGHSVISLEELQ